MIGQGLPLRKDSIVDLRALLQQVNEILADNFAVVLAVLVGLGLLRSRGRSASGSCRRGGRSSGVCMDGILGQKQYYRRRGMRRMN